MRHGEEHSVFINLESDRKVEISQTDFKGFVKEVISQFPLSDESYMTLYKLTDIIDWYKLCNDRLLHIDGKIDHANDFLDDWEMITLLKKMQTKYQFHFKKDASYKYIGYNYDYRFSNIYISNGDGSFEEEEIMEEPKD